MGLYCAVKGHTLVQTIMETEPVRPGLHRITKSHYTCLRCPYAIEETNAGRRVLREPRLDIMLKRVHHTAVHLLRPSSS